MTIEQPNNDSISRLGYSLMKTKHINKVTYNKPESSTANTSLDPKITCSSIKRSSVVTPKHSSKVKERNNNLFNKSFHSKT